jgi:hypothetical protein
MSTDLRSIRTFKELTRYLEDELDWPLGEYEFEELTFTYEPSELGLKAEDAVKVKTIRQLRPFRTNQPWGIFFVEFEKKNLPIVVLRRILRHLVLKKRASANAADAKRWQSRDLLFISAWGDEARREMTFAHFVDHPEMGLAELRVLGWDDDDTPLHMNQVAARLGEKLRWDDDLAADPEAWREQWSSAFVLRHRHVITKSEELAAALAELAKRLRNRLRTILRMEDGFGEIRKLQRAFREGLIHDLDDDAFADMFAQTVTYGLFSVSVRRTFPGEGTAIIKDDVPNLIFTSPFLKEMLGIFLGIKSRKGAIDFDELGVSDVTDLLTSPDTHMEVVLADFNNKTRGEDPVIHFYEHFLKAYNKELKVQRGVFYTPNPIVSYIVRSVDELLKTEFGLEHGLADTITWGEFIKRSKIRDPKSTISLPPLTDEPGCTETISPDEFFVQILDPATGTATFPVEVIDVIYNYLKNLWEKRGAAAMPSIPNSKSNFQNFSDYWNEYVPKGLLPRLHAYELMMAPYAIAHMKIGLKLAETGYKFATEERARIYLTNALEPWVKQLRLPEFEALAHEAAAVNEIKRHKRFTVVIGNPPYSLVSANMEPVHRALVERYKFIAGVPLRERGALQLEKILNDDYVKFIAKSQDILTAAGTGLVGLITNHAYLDNPTMRGLRHSFLASFKQSYFYDLGGSAKKVGENVDVNVFDIQQGVAISITVKSDHASSPANHYARLVGVRETKYKILGESSVKDTSWSELSPSPPYYLFVPTDYELRTEYEHFVPLAEIFPLHSIGSFTSKDHFVISRDPQQLIANAKAFRDSKLPDKELCKSFEINPKDAWDVSRSRDQIRRLSDGDIAKRVLRFTHRPFDLKHIFFHRSLVWSLAHPVNRNLVKPGNLALVTSRQLATPPWNHVFCANAIVEMFLMSNKTKEGNHVFPLYVLPDDEEEQRSLGNEESRPNLFSAFLKRLATTLNLPQAKPHNLPCGLTPEEIFNYAYAAFYSPGYRSRYAEFLKIDFPRLPLTGSLDLFRALAKLGGQLTALHLLKSPKLDIPITEFIGPRNPVVEKITWSDDTVWIDKKQTIGFQGVPENVWNFHIGAYQVCQKWLKDRKDRTLTKDDIAHYHMIVIALSETIHLMAEIDEVIDQHGGWPGAFQSATASGAFAPPEPAPPKRAPSKPAKRQATPSDAFIPGELFGVEGELKPAKKAKAARKAAKKAANPKPASTPRTNPAPDKNDLMALIREIMAKHGPCDRDALTKLCAQAMGYQRVVQSVAEIITNAIRTAKRRGFLVEEQSTLHLDRTPLDQWDRTFLKTQLLATLNQNGRIWLKREETTRLFARWLGFRRTGHIIEETTRSLINGLLRDRSIEKDGQDWIRRT